PEKTRMTDAVFRAMEREVKVYSSPHRSAEPENGKTLSLKVGDFNVDYPWAFVLVEPAEAVYEVALHDPDGKDEHAYQERGEYLYRTIDDDSDRRSLSSRIQAHAITRTLVVGGADRRH